jgi:hypothetical protein
MWAFSLLLGTVSWMVLFKILKFENLYFPNRELYHCDDGQACGLLYKEKIQRSVSNEGYETEELVEWSSKKNQGRRAFIGELCKGLSRDERRQVLSIMRYHLHFSEGGPCERMSYLYGVRPVVYLFSQNSKKVVQRMFAPSAWKQSVENPENMVLNLSFSEWCNDISEWYLEKDT